MTRVRVFLVALVIAAVSFALTPSQAGGLCYNLKISSRGKVLINQWVGACGSGAEIVSQTTQRIGDTTLQTTRYAPA